LSTPTNFYEKRSPSTIAKPIVQSPIFVGLARQLVNSIIINGNNSINTDINDAGLLFNFNLTMADIIYWKQVGNYLVNTIDLLRSTLFVSTLAQNENIEFTQHQYTMFCVDNNTQNIVFTASLTSAVFNTDGSNKDVVSFTINELIPSGLDLTQSNYSVYISYVDNLDLDISYFIQNENVVNINNSMIPLFQANGLNSYVNISWNLYYDVIDYRYITINIGDTIPSYLINNLNNPLGQALVKHQLLSTTQATLLTIPSNTIDSIEQALSIIVDNSWGYYIVPLFTDPALPELLNQLAITWQQDNAWFVNFVSYPSNAQKVLATGSVTYFVGC
jgi:hypothetical protein